MERFIVPGKLGEMVSEQNTEAKKPLVQDDIAAGRKTQSENDVDDG